MLRPDHKSAEVIVIDDEDEGLSTPTLRRPAPPQSEMVTSCYLCKRPTNSSQLSMCVACFRTFHLPCLPSAASKSEPLRCADCQSICGKCLTPLAEKLRCPRCALSYHPSCEALMNELRTRQVCAACVSELLSVQNAIEVRYPPKDIFGQRYAVVKLKALSFLHLTYVPETNCQGIPISDQYFPSRPPPSYQYETVLRWKGSGELKMGLVKFRGRPDSESVWEYEFVINAAKPDQYQTEEWVCNDIFANIRPPTIVPPKTIVEKAQDLILAFGFDPDAPISAIQRAYSQLKLAEADIEFKALKEELPNVLTQACIHFNTGVEAVYKGATLKVKEVFFRNIEVLLIRNCLKDVSVGRKYAVSVSDTYKSSFPDFKSWNTSNDLLLLKSVETFGFGRWREVMKGLVPPGQNLYELYKMVYGEDPNLQAASLNPKLEVFVEQRTRFLVYCLMEDEYLSCDTR